MPPVKVPSVSDQNKHSDREPRHPAGVLRVLLRHRASLVRVRTSLKNRIHAVLADEAAKVEGEKLWSEEGQAWLAAVSVREMHRLVIDDCCGMLDALAIPIGRLEADNRRQAKAAPGRGRSAL